MTSNLIRALESALPVSRCANWDGREDYYFILKKRRYFFAVLIGASTRFYYRLIGGY